MKLQTKQPRQRLIKKSWSRLISGLLAVALLFILSSSVGAANLTHRVQRGESWWSIGQRYGVNYVTLAQANSRSASQYIYVGEVLTIPGTSGTPNPTPTPRPATPTPAPGNSTHTVARGESWWAIGQRYGVNYVTLANANGKSPNDIIYVGQVLIIPGHGGSTPAPTSAPSQPTPTNRPAQPTATPVPSQATRHTVVRGESWWSIGQRYGVNYITLAQANGKSHNDILHIGQVLTIPGTGGSTPTVAPTAAPTTAPNPTQPPATADLQVISVNTVNDARMKSEAGKYKVILAPNTVNMGQSPGLGLGMMIKTPNNRTIMIDGGMQEMVGTTTNLATGAGSGELANVKAWLSHHAGNQVDTWIITHPHNDHARVPSAIIHENQVSIGRVFGVEYPKALHDAKVGDETPTQSAFIYDAYNKVKAQGKYTEIAPGMKISVDGVHIEFLNGYNANLWRENDSSTVMRITFDGSSRVILLLADVQEEGANLLMQRYPNHLKADVVQMSHHGIDPLVSLYDRIQPSIALIPAGGSLAARPSVVQNSANLTSRYGTTNYFANNQWHIVEIRR